MNEFAPDMLVILADEEKIIAQYRLSELLPEGFGPKQLE
jgi:cytidine deaminase